MFLWQKDRKIGLSKAVAAALHDPRNPGLIVHECVIWWRNGLWLGCGYENLNDYAALKSAGR